jgi:indole-3-glycerol phosphate synthase
MSRFRQAISEGDGISVIPVLSGDVAALAEAAAASGAEAVAVEDAGDAARAGAALPVLVREPIREPEDLERVRSAGADACVVVFRDLADEDDRLEELVSRAHDLGFDCAVDVRDDEELEAALERIDPDIIVVSERDDDREEERLERTFDLLADVPAGKLVISDNLGLSREQVLALERAGVDAVVVRGLSGSSAFGDELADLVHGTVQE